MPRVVQAPRSDQKEGLSLQQLTQPLDGVQILWHLHPEFLLKKLYGFSSFLPITVLFSPGVDVIVP